MAGTYAYEGEDLVTGWHSHDLHQVEYAFEGVVEVETEAARYLLPPQQALWIPAGLHHQTTIMRAKTVSVFFAPDMISTGDLRARVLAAAPVIREMILYGSRWPIGRTSSDELADSFFDTLASLVVEWLDHEAPLSLPTSRDPVISAVMTYTATNLETVQVSGLCHSVGLSERTLRRRFQADTGMTWRSYLLESRLLRSMALLVEPGSSVLDVATSVGFDSVSAFTRAFKRHTGETPSEYRRRVTTSTSG